MRNTGCPRRETFRMDMVSTVHRLEEFFAYRMFEAGAPYMNHFGNDRHGDFFRKHGPDVQADRHVHAFETLARNALGLELLGDRADFALAADHADVSRIGLRRP